MSVPINEALFQVGTFEQRNFSKDCEIGDTETFETTGSQRVVFPEQFPAQASVRVIATANNLGAPAGTHNAALVGAVQDVTVEGFVLKARNSDCADEVSLAGMNWMAVAETPGVQQKPTDIRMGMLQPRSFSPDCVPGDTTDWGITFSAPLDGPRVVVVTASDLNVQGHNAAAVGIVLGSDGNPPAPTGFALKARNSDCAPGGCGFYYAAISPGIPGNGSLIVDTGEVSSQNFFNDCSDGDTRAQEVYFSRPFLTPPMILVTANDGHLGRGLQHQAFPVGMARSVTPYGFTLVGRNSDCFTGDGGIIARGKVPGQAGFFWVAIGCALGCG
jgi:hypothetical protein